MSIITYFSVIQTTKKGHLSIELFFITIGSANWLDNWTVLNRVQSTATRVLVRSCYITEIN